MISGMKFLLFIGAFGWGLIFYLAGISKPSDTNRKCGDTPEREMLLGKHRKPRMIGGENVGVNFWPWQVSVLYQPNSSVPFSQVCGGAIIDDYWIMTAASCADVQNQSKLLIRAGSSRLDVDDEFTQKSQVARIIKHKLFNPVTLRYSIALFEMETPFVLNEFVYPICVPDDAVADHKFSSCHITGYNAQPGGDVGVLQEANVFIMSRSLCNKPAYWNYTVSADMLCVGEFGGGVDGCETNLGGPLNCYIRMEQHYYLIGIRVKATSCGEPNRPNIYLKVSNLYYWIELQTNKSFH